MDKHFREKYDPIVIASTGSITALYMEVTTAFILLKDHWNEVYEYTAAYTLLYAATLTFINPIASSIIDKSKKPLIFMVIFTLTGALLSFMQFTFDSVTIFFILAGLKNVSRAFVSPSIISQIRYNKISNYNIQIGNLQILSQASKLVSPALIAVVIFFNHPRFLLLLIGVMYSSSLILYLNQLRLSNNSVSTNTSVLVIKNEPKKLTSLLDINLITFLIISTLVTMIIYSIDSFIIYRISELGYSSFIYSVLVGVSGLFSIYVSKVINRAKKTITLKQTAFYIFIWSCGYLSIGVIDPAYMPSSIALTLLLLSFMTINGACSAKQLMMTLCFQNNVSRENSAKAVSLTHVSIGIAMLLGPMIGIYMTKITTLQNCFTISGIVAVCLSLLLIAISK